MAKYIEYTIEALENLKFSKTNMQKESENTMKYITGSSIRGAYIYKYIKNNNVDDINTSPHREKLLKGGVKFLNAYPINMGERSIPFPKTYFAPKDEMREFKNNKDSLNMQLGLDKKLDEGYQKVRQSEFVRYRDGEYIQTSVATESNLHINKKNKYNKLFRYESIKKRQSFKGIIKVEDESYIKEVKNLLENTIIYLGGSKGSGYGKCIIKDFKVTNENPEKEKFSDFLDVKREFYIFALSDIIYRNNLGEYKTYIEEDYLKEKLGTSIKFIESNIETKDITNFNNKWGANTPQVISIKAGSVLKYSSDAEISKEKLIKFINEGIGIRKDDGYGRFMIVNNFTDAKLSKNNNKIQKNIDEDKILGNLNQEQKEFLKNIVKEIYQTRLNSKLNSLIIDIDDNLINQKDLSSNQWGKLKNLFNYLSYQKPIDGINTYKKYITHIKNKNNSNFRSLNKIKYKIDNTGNCISFIEYLDYYMENSHDKRSISNYYNKNIDFKNIEVEFKEEEIYKFNMNLLTELCRYNLRKEEN